MQIYTRIWAAKSVIQGCSDIPAPQRMAEHCTDQVAPSAGGGADGCTFSLLWFRITRVMEWDLRALLGFLNGFTALFQENWEKNSDSRMLLEFCSGLAQSLIPITHRCQVEIMTLNRNNWPEPNPRRKKETVSCFQEKENILSGKQLLQSCIQWLRACTKRSWRTDHKFRTCIPDRLHFL